jgi:hypothetical protein
VVGLRLAGGGAVTALFVSHASADNGVTGRLASWLEQAGFAARFVDFDPEVGIPAGRLWERELFAQLARCDGLVFVASPSSVASQWCFAELAMARSQGKPIFPVQVVAGTRHRLLEDVQGVDATDDEPGGFARLVAGLEAAGLRAADSFGWDGSRPPYPGLAAFDVADAAVFFGRDGEVHRLLERLAPAGVSGVDRSIAVVGPSGSGKSSLVRAGLLPRLARQGGRWVVVGPLMPGERPVVSLARALASAFGSHGRAVDRRQVQAELSGGQRQLVELLDDLCQLAGGDQMRVLLAVDQAEELLTRASEQERARFLELLEPSRELEGLIWVVTTLRTEALDRFATDEALAGLIGEPMVVGPLPRGRLAEVIARPAKRAGLAFEAGLVDRMVDDTVGGDALPLLSYTLRELSERAELGRDITHADYDHLGGVIGALQKQADRVTYTLTRQGAGETVLPSLLRLTTIEAGGEPARRRVPRDRFTGYSHDVIQSFVDARLLVAASHEDTATVEVAHEALLRQWPPLRQTIEASRRELELRADLERHARDWDTNGRDESYLLRGARLDELAELELGRHGQVDPLEQDYLAASRARATADIEATRRSNRRLRRLVAALAVLLVAAIAASGIAIGATEAAQQQTRVAEQQRRLAEQETLRAEQQAELARSRELAARALALVDDRPHQALLVALESARTAATAEAVDVLVSRLSSPLHAFRDFFGHEAATRVVAYSPDGSTIVSGSDDGTLRLWDATDGTPLGEPLTGHDGGVNSVAYSPDGSAIVSGSDDGTLRLWDAMDGFVN